MPFIDEDTGPKVLNSGEQSMKSLKSVKHKQRRMTKTLQAKDLVIKEQEEEPQYPLMRKVLLVPEDFEVISLDTTPEVSENSVISEESDES